MSATEPLVRYRHIPLPTQQRRLRHLRSIAVRNIISRVEGFENCDLTQIETYFTLHHSPKASAFYTSEKITGTLNPTWRCFSLEHLNNSYCQKADTPVNTAQTFFVVCVWRGLPDNARLCIEWSVNLGGLLYLGDKAQREGVHYPPNTVLFGILDGVYSMPTTKPPAFDPSSCHLQVEQGVVRSSYSTQTVLRVKTVLRAIKQTQASVNRVKSSIEGKLLHSQSLKEKCSQRECQILKNNMMHSDLEWRAQVLRSEKETLEDLQTENREKENCLVKQFALLQKERGELHEKKKGYFDVREELIKTGAQLVMRRKQLITELAFIYPIVETPALEYNICGVRLPHSEDFAGQDETMIAVALGYTCHLVHMISHFLDVPLRYPMFHEGSRSMIRDHIIDKLTDRERDFPLFSKGKEKFQFNYGVYLLNKNIAQLRYYCTLGTTDLRLTLPNLKSLLELRLGVKFESTNIPVFESQHLSIPPNLGGPQSSSKVKLVIPSLEKLVDDSTKNTELSTNPEMVKKHDDKSSHCGDGDDTNSSETVTSEKSKGDESQTIIEGQLDNAINEMLHCNEKTEAFHNLANVNKKSTNCENKQHVKDIAAETLKELSAQRLLASYEEIEASSTEDSASATYSSSFKMWSREGVDLTNNEKDTEIATVSTFKTKAMVSPTSPESNLHGMCDDLLMQVENQSDNKPDGKAGMKLGVGIIGPFHRERTESGTDSEDSATFVVPGNRPPLQSSLVIQQHR